MVGPFKSLGNNTLDDNFALNLFFYCSTLTVFSPSLPSLQAQPCEHFVLIYYKWWWSYLQLRKCRLIDYGESAVLSFMMPLICSDRRLYSIPQTVYLVTVYSLIFKFTSNLPVKVKVWSDQFKFKGTCAVKWWCWFFTQWNFLVVSLFKKFITVENKIVQ